MPFSRSVSLVFFFVFLSTGLNAFAGLGLPDRPLGPEASTEAIRELRGAQDGIKAVSMSFVQTKSSAMLADDMVTSGTVLVKKPGLLRWEVKKPERIIIVVDEDVLWFYRPARKEARKRLLSKDFVAGQAMGFFTSIMNLSLEDLEKRFIYSLYRAGDNVVLELVPKSKFVSKYLKGITIWYRQSDGIPVKFAVLGKKGDTTVTEFKNINIKAVTDENDFHLKLPENVRVISDEEEEIQ